MSKWWLISEEDVREIEKALGECTAMRDTVDGEVNSEVDALLWGLENRSTAALHTLHSGLNETDAVPDDFRRGKAE